MAIKVFADGANLEGMLDMYENGNVQGFTTNPSLMKKGGVTDYRAFAKEVLAHITDVSVSFEVFADDVETMEVEAREIATWAENVYVKIPCVTTKGESTAELVRKLSADGIKVNVTTIFTPAQSMRWSRPLTPRRVHHLALCRPHRRHRRRSHSVYDGVGQEGRRQAQLRGPVGIHA